MFIIINKYLEAIYSKYCYKSLLLQQPSITRLTQLLHLTPIDHIMKTTEPTLSAEYATDVDEYPPTL